MDIIVHVKWPNMYNLSTYIYCTDGVKRSLSGKENDCCILYSWCVRISVVIFGQLYDRIIKKTSFKGLFTTHDLFSSLILAKEKDI